MYLSVKLYKNLFNIIEIIVEFSAVESFRDYIVCKFTYRELVAHHTIEFLGHSSPSSYAIKNSTEPEGLVRNRT